MAEQSEELVVKFSAQGASDVAAALKSLSDGLEKVDQKTPGKGGRGGNGLFDLESNRRVRRQLGGLAQDLLNVQDPAQIANAALFRLSETVRVGLGVGVAASVGFALVQGLGRAAEAAAKLNTEITNLTRPHGNADFLGLEDVQKNLTDVGGKLDEIFQRDIQERPTVFGAARKGLRFLPGVLSGASPSELSALDEKQRSDLRLQAARSVDDLARKTLNLNKVDLDRIVTSERQADLDKAELEHRERLGDISRAASVAGTKNTSATHAENERADIEKANIGHKHDLIDEQLRFEREIARIGTEFLGPERQSLAVAEAKVHALERQAQTMHFLTDQERARLQIAKENAIADETKTQVDRAVQGPFPNLPERHREERASELREQFELEKLRNEPNDSGTADRVRHIKELQLFQDERRRDELKGVGDNSIVYGAAGEAFRRQQSGEIRNLDERIKAERKSLGLQDAQPENANPAQSNAAVIESLNKLIETLNELPAKVGVL